MCNACLNLSIAPRAAPPEPLRVQFAPPASDWTCYTTTNNQLQWVPPPPIVPKLEEKSKEEAKEKPKEKPKEKKPAKPALKPGATYVYPLRSTYVHLIRDVKVWKKDTGVGWGFKMHRVPVSLSVGEFIEAMTGGETEGMAVTEVVELGDGEFSKGTSVKFGTGKAGGTMASFAWNEKRGDSLPPVWLVLHKA